MEKNDGTITSGNITVVNPSIGIRVIGTDSVHTKHSTAVYLDPRDHGKVINGEPYQIFFEFIGDKMFNSRIYYVALGLFLGEFTRQPMPRRIKRP